MEQSWTRGIRTLGLVKKMSLKQDQLSDVEAKK